MTVYKIPLLIKSLNSKVNVKIIQSLLDIRYFMSEEKDLVSNWYKRPKKTSICTKTLHLTLTSTRHCESSDREFWKINTRSMGKEKDWLTLSLRVPLEPSTHNFYRFDNSRLINLLVHLVSMGTGLREVTWQCTLSYLKEIFQGSKIVYVGTTCN